VAEKKKGRECLTKAVGSIKEKLEGSSRAEKERKKDADFPLLFGEEKEEAPFNRKKGGMGRGKKKKPESGGVSVMHN